MSETSDNLDQPESARSVTPLCLNVRKALAQKGMTQRQLKTALARQGIDLSEASISRTLNGDRKLSPAELEAVCKVLDLPYDESRVPLAPVGEVIFEADKPEPSAPGPKGSSRRLRARGITRRHAIVFGIIVGAILAVAVTAVAVSIASGGSKPNPAGQAGNSNALPTPVRPPGCGQYEVTANDLALRDEYGTPLTELPHGTKVTVKNLQHPRGLPYWQVTTDDGLTNWVDHRYLKQIC
jgi:transcriptional regulator with XRE-family HTH domain